LSGAPGLSWKGVWSTSTNYSVGDAVTYAGSSYIATVDNTSQQPDTSASVWTILARQGASTVFTSGASLSLLLGVGWFPPQGIGGLNLTGEAGVQLLAGRACTLSSISATTDVAVGVGGLTVTFRRNGSSIGSCTISGTSCSATGLSTQIAASDLVDFQINTVLAVTANLHTAAVCQ
jgi:hypothetical protein